VERQNGTLKDKLAKICEENGLKWPDALPLALMAMRSTPQRRNGLSPHKIVLGRPMKLPVSPPLSLKQMDDTMLNFCFALTTAARVVHSQVKAACWGAMSSLSTGRLCESAQTEDCPLTEMDRSIPGSLGDSHSGESGGSSDMDPCDTLQKGPSTEQHGGGSQRRARGRWRSRCTSKWNLLQLAICLIPTGLLLREYTKGGGDPFAAADPGAGSSPADRFEPEPGPRHPALQSRGAEKEVPKSTHPEVLKTSKGESHVEKAREGLLLLPCLSSPCVIHEADDSTQTGNQREEPGEGKTLSVFLRPLHEADDSTQNGDERILWWRPSVVSRKPRPLPELR